MANLTLLSLGLCFIVLFHGYAAQIEQVTTEHRQGRQQPRLQRSTQDQCRLERINVVEPSRRIQSEAGTTDVWDENDEQFQCAGVVAMRHTIQERGLLLPQYVNGPKLIYVVEGNGVQGALFPGCPETFQSPSESSSEYRVRGESRREDRHQKVRQLREGDIIALPAGVAHWVYNNGRTPLVLVQIIDTANPANQLDQNHRDFFLAGNPQQDIQSQRGLYSKSRSSRAQIGLRGSESRREGQFNAGNIFSGMDEQMLADAFNINTDLARRLRSENDNRGMIVSVEHELEIITPKQSQEEEQREMEEERQREFERRQGGKYLANGVEETFCTARLKHNINDPSRADIFNPQAGRLTTINSFNLPILSHLRLSAQKGVLYSNAIMAPHWNMNAHSICYFTRGSGRVQIVDDNGESVFDGQVQEGQMLTFPQNFVVVKRANNEGLSWVSFKTNDNAKINQLAGRVSAIRAMPDDVVANAFQVSREDARRLKENRQEVTLFSPGSRSSSRY